jgi:hypothetical protein
MTAAQFKEALVTNPASVVTGDSGKAVYWVEQAASGAVTALASWLPPNARTGLVIVLRD